MIAIVMFALAVASHGFESVQSSPVTAINATAVCYGEANIKTLNELHSVAGQLKNGAACPAGVKESTIALADAIKATSQDACSTASVEKIKTAYVDLFTNDIELPQSVETIVLSYAMQLSKKCKAHMVDVFTTKMDGVINEYANIDISKLSDGGDMVDRLIRDSLKDEVILPNTLGHLFADAGKGFESLNLNPAEQAQLDQIGELCAKQLRPIYEPLVKPIVTLAQITFDYPDGYVLKEHAIDEKQREKLNLINRIVYLCETTNVGNDKHVDSGRYKQVVVEPSSKVVIDTVELIEGDDYLPLIEVRKNELEHLMQSIYITIMNIAHDKRNHLKPEEVQALEQAVACTKTQAKIESEDDFEIATDNNVPKACGRKIGQVNLVWVLIALGGAYAIAMASAQ